MTEVPKSNFTPGKGLHVKVGEPIFTTQKPIAPFTADPVFDASFVPNKSAVRKERTSHFNKPKRAPSLSGASSSQTDDHAHRWRIDEPNGPISRGVCKHCSAERNFKNWLPETDFITNEDRQIST